MIPPSTDNQRVSQEQADFELDGLLRLSKARDAIDLLVEGHWPATSRTARAIEALVAAGAQRLAWAELVTA